MRLFRRHFSGLLFLIACIGTNPSIGQITADASLKDDPVAAALDSLVQLNIFEKYTKPFSSSNKYKFPADSIPVYDDATIQERLQKLDAQSPFDLVFNSDVKKYINMYLNRRTTVSKVLGLSQLYFPLFEEKLDKYNLPLELKYLAIVESALNPTVKSKAGAVGLWQFMYATGKMYNLKINSYVDERCDPIKETEAACEFLTFLYETFGDWQVAIAAYNCGPGNISKAIRRSGGKTSYWEIRAYLPKETQAYVPSFIAVNYVMNYAAEYNLYDSVPKKTFYQVDTVHVKMQMSFSQLASLLDITVEELEYLNPVYRKNVIPYIDSIPSVLTLPIAKVGTFTSNEATIYAQLKKDSVNLTMTETMKVHVVKSGEKINTVALKYKCSVADIMAWNSLKSYKLYPGQKLTVYVPTNVPTTTTTKTTVKTNTTVNNTKPVALQDKTTVNTGNNTKYKYHTIKSGDSLWTLSQKYGTTVDELKKLNGFGTNYMLHPGMVIKVGTGS